MTIQALNSTSPSFGGNVVIKNTRRLPQSMRRALEGNSVLQGVANDGYNLKVRVLSKKALSANENHTAGTELYKVKISAMPEKDISESKLAYRLRTMFGQKSFNLTRRYHTLLTNLDALSDLSYWKLKNGLNAFKS